MAVLCGMPIAVLGSNRLLSVRVI